MENTITFTSGKSYHATSICDHNCVWTVKVVKRTKKFLTVIVDGEQKRCGVQEWNGVEVCYFSGKYSMAPSIKADRVAK